MLILVSILAVVWILGADYFFGQSGGQPLFRRVSLALGWPVLMPLYWLVNRWAG